MTQDKKCCQICGDKIKRRVSISGYAPNHWEGYITRTIAAFPYKKETAEKFWGKGNFVKIRIEYQELK